jgi:alkylation response protein AidB-like acyl-CoA dehydrogenase
MDFKFTPEQETLRAEFEEFFAAEEKRAPEGWTGGIEALFASDEGWVYHRSVAQKLAERGWLALPWPKEYGGKEHSYMEQLIFSEVKSYHRVPGADLWGPYIVAPSLLEYGSEEIKREWLPRIARAEINWCQGWSEPGAGSDLASLTTRAVEDGDDYVINGQKTWTSGAHRADHIFLLARTDPNAPKHRGITYFLSEMDRPGITVRPLLFMNRRHDYNEVYFDNLRIPKRNIVGPVNSGWYVTMAGINFERSMVGAVAEAKRDLEDLVEFCKQTRRDGQILAKDPLIRQRLAEFAIELEALRQWAYNVAWLQSKNPMIAGEPSAAKYFATELWVRLANAGVEIMGLYGTLKTRSKWANLQGKFENACQANLGITLAGGSTEAMINIISWMALKLPRIK